METKVEKQWPHNGPLISVPHKDTIRLLEVYVKRSISLNDGNLGYAAVERKEKWVTKKHRRHSSDPSLHRDEEPIHREISSVVEPPPAQPETLPSASEKPGKKASKKTKKPSFLKSLVSFFTRKSNEDKDEEQDGPPEMPETFEDDEASDDAAATTCLPTPAVGLQKRKSLRKRSIRRRFSKKNLILVKPNKPSKDFTSADITGVQAVEPTYSYYEKVSEELEKIVHEVKEKEEVGRLSDEEVINRIIALMKEEGDAIEDKLKDHPTMNNFFQGMSYTSFQRLADAYLEEEAAPISKPPTVLPTAPELVKLAFTIDFTARIAGLSRQNISHITCLGNRYLQDRFEYKQVCTDHPWSDCED